MRFFHDHDHEFTIWTITCEGSGRYPEQFFPETSSDIAQDNRGQTLIDYLVSHFIHLIFGSILLQMMNRNPILKGNFHLFTRIEFTEI